MLRLGGPLIANNLAVSGMNLADTVMSGRFGARDLAAVAVGASLWFIALLFALGMLMAMSPIAAHSYGAGQNEVVGSRLRQGLWLSLLLAAMIVVVVALSRPFFNWIGIDPDIAPLAADYLHALAWGAPAITAYLALRFTSEGVGWTRPIMYIAMFGLVINVFANYVLMYGKLGFPAMGAVGCGYASAITMWIMCIALFAYMSKVRRYRLFELFSRFEWPSWIGMREIVVLGLPIGLATLAEVAMFNGAGLLVGTMGGIKVASHQIALNVAATMFMIPLAMHSATTIHAGHALGRGDWARGRHIGYIGIWLCGGVMLISAGFMLLFRHTIVGFYTEDIAVAQLAAALLLFAAIFQVSDGLQVGAAGALRGFKDTRIPGILNVFAYWVVGFPMAWYLGVSRDMGPQGVWIGLIIGLSVCAVFLNLRYWWISRDKFAPTENVLQRIPDAGHQISIPD